MNSEDLHKLCQASTRSGQPCKNFAVAGSSYCRVHQAGNGASLATGASSGAANLQPAVSPPDEPGSVRSAEPSVGATRPAPDVALPEDLFNPSIQHQLAAELENLIQRVRASAGSYSAPAYSSSRLIEMIRQNIERFSPDTASALLERLRSTLSEDLLNVETWKGLWFVLNYSIQLQAGWIKRRLLGEYQTDDWGLDWDFVEAIRPFFEFMYRHYWRVETTGLENVPAMGRGLLVANHSGQLPWDGMMIATAVLSQHPSQRLVRNLYASWFPTLPFFSAMFLKLGQALATVDNGTRLLEQDELVGVYPEGYKGVGKLYRERYRLARFGRGGFVKMAMKTGAPIIPISVVGAEETYIALGKSPAMAKLLGWPYFPITPTFPWLGLLGFIPLPIKWYIDIGEPISVDNYEPDAAENVVLVSQLSDQVRKTVQQQIYVRLAQRKSIFFG